MPDRLDPAADRRGTRTERRVARTKTAIENAFVQLVLEHGYRALSMEDISEQADVARATVYAHFSNKEAILMALLTRLGEDLMRRLDYESGPWTQVRRGAIHGVYQHVADAPDLYRACLSDTRGRQACLFFLTQYAEQNFRDRSKALKREQRVPIEVMARGYAGAHLAIIESWLDGDIHLDTDTLATAALDMLVAGLAWAQGVSLVELGYESESSPPERRRRPATANQTKREPKSVKPGATRTRTPIRANERPSTA